MVDLSSIGIYDLKDRFGYAQIITHTDLDGYGAGAVLYQMLIRLGFDPDNIEITHTEYTDVFPVKDKYNLVFLSDISLSTGDDCQKVLDFTQSPNNLLFWFDHHKSSLDMYKYYNKLKWIPGIRSVNACGAMLCYIFNIILGQFISYNSSHWGNPNISILDLRDLTLNLPIKEIRDAMINDQNIEIKIKNKCVDDVLYDTITFTHRMPYALRLTDDYDRFVLADDNSKYLIYAFKNYPGFEHNCRSRYFHYHYLTNSPEGSESHRETKKLIDEGRKFFLWSKIFSLIAIRDYGFISSLLVEGCSDIDFLCVNTTVKGSMGFGRCFGNHLTDEEKNYMQYNYVMAYSYLGSTLGFTGSIYCADPQNPEVKEIGKIYDAADIAKKLHGGGHAGAAGFVNKDIPFVDVRKLPQKLIDQINAEIIQTFAEIDHPEIG